MDMEEYVYESLQGTIMDPHPQVESLFEEGMDCDRWYGEVLDAYQRLCHRLGVGDEDEDEDVEVIITNLNRIQRKTAYRMYYYGAKFKKDE